MSIGKLQKLQNAIQTSLLKTDLLETRSNIEISNGSILVYEEYHIVENLSSVGKNVRFTYDVEKTGRWIQYKAGKMLTTSCDPDARACPIRIKMCVVYVVLANMTHEVSTLILPQG